MLQGLCGMQAMQQACFVWFTGHLLSISHNFHKVRKSCYEVKINYIFLCLCCVLRWALESE